MNIAERDFYAESSRKAKIEAEKELRVLVSKEIAYSENQDMVINFILENKMAIRNLIGRLVG